MPEVAWTDSENGAGNEISVSNPIPMWSFSLAPEHRQCGQRAARGCLGELPLMEHAQITLDCFHVELVGEPDEIQKITTIRANRVLAGVRQFEVP